MKNVINKIKEAAQKVAVSSPVQRSLHPLAKQTRIHKYPGTMGTFGKSGVLRTAWRNRAKCGKYAAEVATLSVLLFVVDEGLDRLGVYK